MTPISNVKTLSLPAGIDPKVAQVIEALHARIAQLEKAVVELQRKK